MKGVLLTMAIALSLSFTSWGQEKWTCYTDDKVLLMDDYRTLGAFEYADGSLWMVTDRGINILRDGQWNKIDKKTELLRNKIGAYLVDSQDRIWVGTGTPDMFFDGYAFSHLYQGGVVIFDGKEWKPMNTKEMGIKAPVITRIFEASNSDIWLTVSSVRPGAEGSGLFAKGAILRFSNEEWTVYKAKDVPCLSCEFVKGIYEDDRGTLFFWAEEGLFYFENEGFHRVTKDEGYNLKSWPNAAFVDSKNNLWLAGGARVSMYDGTKWTAWNRKNGLPSTDWPPIGLTETADNQIILTAMNGLYRLNNENQWEQEKLKFIHGNTYIDSENRVWIPTNKGLLIKDETDETLHKDLPKVWAIIEDKDDGVWALSRREGTKRFKDGKWQHFNKDNELPADRILLGYVADNGTVWIATPKGICSCEYN